MHYEKKLSGEQVFSGKIVNIFHDRVELENGNTAWREVIRHSGAVGVLCKDGGQLVFVRQYRYAVKKELLEITAGKLEPGEDPQSAAVRELREETGLLCKNLTKLGEFYASPGVYDEVIHIYFTDDVTFVGEQPDADEFVTVVRMKPEEIEKMIAEGLVQDGKTVYAFAAARARGLL